MTFFLFLIILLTTSRGGAVWQLAWLITTRSLVQIQPPQHFTKYHHAWYFFLTMESNIYKIIDTLAEKVEHLEQPIHVIAVCSGGRSVGERITEFLKNKGIEVEYFEAWTNIVNGKATIWKSSFKKDDYTGTALIAEDVIWMGRSVGAVKEMLHNMKDKKIYTAVLLDCNNKADFSVFHG